MTLRAIDYHDQTKHTPERVRSATPTLDWDNKPTPYKDYTDTPSIGLPDRLRPAPVPAIDAITESTGVFPDRTPTLEELAQICYYAAGITKTLTIGGRPHPFRAAACTGALYHIDLYPVTGPLPDRDLDPGVYHFDPRNLSLDVLRDDADYRGVLTDATGQDPHLENAPAAIVLTSTWWRNAWKYGDRTYRHAFWDAGTILANLLAVAHSLDLTARVVTAFADHHIASLLGIDPPTEAAVAIVPIGTADPTPPPTEVTPIDPPTSPLSPDPQDHPAITNAYHASALPDGDAARNWRNHAPTNPLLDPPDDHAHDLITLPDVPRDNQPDRALHETIRRRGSCRNYQRTPITLEETSIALDHATRGVPIDVTADAPLTFNQPYLITNAITDLDPGAYHYNPNTRTLGLLDPGEYRQHAGHLALDQPLGANASINEYYLTDLTAVTSTLGDRGYRAAQLEAAITAGRAYLAAYAHDTLGATGLTFYDDDVTRFFEPAATNCTPMFLWTAGRPA